MADFDLQGTITAVQGGDKAAFEALYNEYCKQTHFLALKLMKNEQDAQDITQDVFLTVHEKIGDLKQGAAFPAWLNKITSNKCVRALQRNHSFTADADELADIEFTEETDHNLIPDKALDDSETARIIVEFVDKLPLPQRVCVYLYYYERLSVKEIAEQLAVNENTVKSRLSAAREKIRKDLEQLEDKEGLRLYMASPLILIPVLAMLAKKTEVPSQVMSQIFSQLNLTAGAATTGAAGTGAAGAGAAGTGAVAATTTAAGSAATGITASGVAAAISAAVLCIVTALAVTGGVIVATDDNLNPFKVAEKYQAIDATPQEVALNVSRKILERFFPEVAQVLDFIEDPMGTVMSNMFALPDDVWFPSGDSGVFPEGFGTLTEPPPSMEGGTGEEIDGSYKMTMLVNGIDVVDAMNGLAILFADLAEQETPELFDFGDFEIVIDGDSLVIWQDGVPAETGYFDIMDDKMYIPLDTGEWVPLLVLSPDRSKLTYDFSEIPGLEDVSWLQGDGIESPFGGEPIPFDFEMAFVLKE